jgi:hypothetical protein
MPTLPLAVRHRHMSLTDKESALDEEVDVGVIHTRRPLESRAHEASTANESGVELIDAHVAYIYPYEARMQALPLVPHVSGGGGTKCRERKSSHSHAPQVEQPVIKLSLQPYELAA